jgi:leader peptidase (prepilin peptidase)/N-methyltransferase
MPIAVDIAALSALATYLVRQYMLKRPLRRSSLMPFGVFLAPAIWIGWLLALTLLAPG